MKNGLIRVFALVPALQPHGGLALTATFSSTNLPTWAGWMTHFSIRTRYGTNLRLCKFNFYLNLSPSDRRFFGDSDIKIQGRVVENFLADIVNWFAAGLYVRLRRDTTLKLLCLNFKQRNHSLDIAFDASTCSENMRRVHTHTHERTDCPVLDFSQLIIRILHITYCSRWSLCTPPSCQYGLQVGWQY